MPNDITLFDYSPITERAPVRWPNGKRVAFYVGLNVEHFYVDLPGTALYDSTTSLLPDALNYGWRDYGPRVATGASSRSSTSTEYAPACC